MIGNAKRAAVLCGVLLMLLSACQEKSFPIAPVSGRVTINGEPVAGAKIKFQPVAEDGSAVSGGGSYATTDEQGNYRLMLILAEGEGAVVGEHRVYITTMQVEANTDAPKITGERVPRRWREGEERFEVPPEGTTEANFDITSPR